MTVRRTLPNRRPAILQDIVFNGRRYTIELGRFQEGEPGPSELFIHQAKPSCDDMGAVSRDAAVALSIAMQYGTPIETIRGAVTRNEDGSPASLIGAVVDMMAEERE
jgi:hypothetical protein